MNPPPFISREAIRRALDFTTAATAIEDALRLGLDPEAEPARSALEFGSGQLLFMPATVGGYSSVKLATIGGAPRIQGVVVVFDARSLSPVALIDGVALTELRTAAVSLAAVRHMTPSPAAHLVVFGRGPQGLAHIEAFETGLDIERVTVLHSASSLSLVSDSVRDADLICCATTARKPLFDGALVSDRAVIVAVGSHEPDARELDASLIQRSTVVVESRRTARREAGDLIMAGLDTETSTTLAELICEGSRPASGPQLFKSTGMGWEDTVIARLLVEAELLQSDR